MSDSATRKIHYPTHFPTRVAVGTVTNHHALPPSKLSESRVELSVVRQVAEITSSDEQLAASPLLSHEVTPRWILSTALDETNHRTITTSCSFSPMLKRSTTRSLQRPSITLPLVQRINRNGFASPRQPPVTCAPESFQSPTSCATQRHFLQIGTSQHVKSAIPQLKQTRKLSIAKPPPKPIFKMYDPTKRPYKDKSISELAHLFNDKCLSLKQLGNVGPVFGPIDDRDDDTTPSTFLKDPASDSAIDSLQEKIRAEPYNFTEGLPEEYVEFLKVTNGIYGYEYAGHNEIFYPIEEVKLEKGFMGLELLPSELSELLGKMKIDWPEPEWGLQLGAGGDQGSLHVYPPHAVKASVDALDKVYKKAKKDEKKEIERVAKDLFGGMEHLKKARYVIFKNYHWAGEIEIFPTFKALLEDFVKGMDDVEEKKNKEKENKDSEENNPEDNGEPSKSKPTNTNRNQIPSGKPNSLSSLKLIFTGTFSHMDRKTSKATTEKYGGHCISKLEDADYVVLGTQAGPKKLATIKEKNLTTISEDGFFSLINGEKPTPLPQSDLSNVSTKTVPPADPNGARKHTAEGKENALKEVKLMFTGTLETMDRATSKKTAEKFGAKVVSTLNQADFIVLGTGAGPKKLEEIEKKGLKTVTEKEFQDMLESGAAAAGDGIEQKAAAADDEGENDDAAGAAADDGDAGGAEEKEEEEKPNKDSNGARNQPPSGDQNSLKGVKLLFTGTLETMDRVSSKKTAEKYGAKVVTSLNQVDFVVLGKEAGPKKLEEIEKKGLRTVSEEEFQDMLAAGDEGGDAVGDKVGEEGGKEKEEKEEPKAKGKGKKRGTPTPGTRSSKRTRKE